MIEPAELHRVFPAVLPVVSKDTLGNGGFHRETAHSQGNGEVRELRAEVRELREAIRFRDETLVDLRRRLDTEAEERRRLTAILADQRAAAPRPALEAPASAWRRFLAWRR